MTENAVMEREAPNLPAERAQHPIIEKIDAKMPEIAEMLPEGMSADRFRRVVVQALVRNPDLWSCTPVSVVSAIVESAQIGLEPTGVLGRAWMLPYTVKGTKEAKLIVGYRGYAELAWRADRILVTTGAVREGDEFSYQRGTDAFLHHVPASEDAEREVNDANITDFWAMYTLPDGRRDFDVMSRKAAERIRDKARYRNPVWDSDFGEMGRKTVLRRLLKVAPLSPEVQRVLGRDEEIDYDTPVERVADPKRDGLRDRIAQRTAALRGESTGVESEGSVTGGAPSDSPACSHPSEKHVATDAGVECGACGELIAARNGKAAPKGDPWMRRLHAMGNERGIDHDALHDWAVRAFGVESLNDLTPQQRSKMVDQLERQPVIESPASGVPTAPAGREGGAAAEVARASVAPPSIETPQSPSASRSATATDVGSEDGASPPGPASGSAPAPTDAEILEAAGPGAEIVPPKPGTDEYRALPNGTERAKAKAYWDRMKAAPAQESLAEALGAPTSD